MDFSNTRRKFVAVYRVIQRQLFFVCMVFGQAIYCVTLSDTVLSDHPLSGGHVPMFQKKSTNTRKTCFSNQTHKIINYMHATL